MDWKETDLTRINAMCADTLMEHLSIEFIGLGEKQITAKMPVDRRHHQPMGRLHGGASVALIESVASMGSALLLDLRKEAPLGLEVNANHIGGIKEGNVVASGELIHQGRKTHVWKVDIHDEQTERLLCSGRITIMIIATEGGR
ncbi:MAG: PaaI family thioesterase [Bacteroidetes bacterium]|nr:MAG: PaaI family thioesterase [Bacteroidota bacterium]